MVTDTMLLKKNSTAHIKKHVKNPDMSKIPTVRNSNSNNSDKIAPTAQPMNTHFIHEKTKYKNSNHIPD